MSTPFDGVGIWVWPAFWGGDDLTAAESAAYAAAGVRWAAIKCSDGTEDNPDYAAQFDVAQAAGLLPIPWCFIDPTPPGTEAAQAETAWKAAGSPPSGAIMLCDIESAINVGALGRALASYGLRWACTTWGDPSPEHNGAPSIGQLADVGCEAFLGQAYYSAWQVSAQGAIQSSVANFSALGLGPYAKPLLPIVDGPAILAAAQEAAKLGCHGISAWRHGANGITSTSFQGVAATFPAVTPAPTYLSLAAPTVVSQLSSPTDPWDACGEACVASVLTDAGSPETAGYIVQQSLAAGNAQTGTTTAANLIALLAKFGVAAHEVKEPLVTAIPAALSRKHEIIVLISCDSDGNPASPGVAQHWMLAWGQDATGDKVMQPLSNPAGQLDDYPYALMAAVDQSDAVEIDVILPKDSGAPMPPPSAGTLVAGRTYQLPDGDRITVN